MSSQIFLFDKKRCVTAHDPLFFHCNYLTYVTLSFHSQSALIHISTTHHLLRYASGATIQVLLFGVLAISLKDIAPSAHTMCEIVRARWGKGAHITFLFFAFCANIIVTSMLLLGGAATVEALTGMKYELASFLIPWGGKFDHITCTML